MRRLLVIAGPSAVGKSTLMNRLFAGELPELAERLCFNREDEWLRRRSRTLVESDDDPGDRLILHYDLHRPEAQGFEEGYRSDPLWDRFRDGWSITFLSLWAPPAVLCRRLRHRRAPLKTEFFKIWKVRQVKHRWSRLRRMERKYLETGWLAMVYQDWFEFTTTFPDSECFVVDAGQSTLQCVPQKEWDEESQV